MSDSISTTCCPWCGGSAREAQVCDNCGEAVAVPSPTRQASQAPQAVFRTVRNKSLEHSQHAA
jgi:rRNA maturation protein Nop10